ncbi:hypothetical protein JCM15519_10840 [Fundidesulfovibrio butyratiphilus]
MAIPSEAEARAAVGEDVARKMRMDALQKRIAPGPSKEKKLKEACEGFEAVFIGQLVKEMRKSVPKDGLLHGNMQDQYVSMFDEEYAKTLTKNGGIGLSDFMFAQLSARDKAVKPEDAKSMAVSGEKRLDPKQGPTLAGVRRTALDRMPVGKPKVEGQTMIQPPMAMKGASATGTRDASSRPVAVGSASLRSGLSGTPSQRLGLPGAAYLQGADKALADAGDSLVQPVSGEITSDFGWRRDPFTHQKAWHSGVDIAAPAGSPVVACADGVVSYSGSRGGYGNLVVVDHSDGTQSYYGHNSANSVTVGQAVQAGQQIAKVGQTGRATGPHVHFELRRNGVAVDPRKAGGITLAARDTSPLLIPDL